MPDGPEPHKLTAIEDDHMTERIGNLIMPATAPTQQPRPAPTMPPGEYARQADFLLARGFDGECAGNLRALSEYRWALTAGHARKGLCLFGAVGRGKTLAFEALGLRVVTARDWLSMYEDGKGAVRDSVSRHRPLVVDDLGTEETYVNFGTRLEVLEEIITTRHILWQRYGILTHITGNLTPDAYDRRYGERLLSRIKGMCRVVVFEGPDRRPGNEGWI